MKLGKLFGVMMAIFMVSQTTHAETEPKNRIVASYGSGDADIKLSGTTYDGDLSGSSISGTFYFGDSLWAIVGFGSSELEIAGVNIEQELTGFGGGLVFGDHIDLTAGEGEEFRVGIIQYDFETSQGSTKSTDDATYAGASYETGLGDGLTLGFYFNTDTADIFSDNDYSVDLIKSLGSNVILGFGYEYSKAVTNSQNSSDSKIFSVGVGFLF